MNRISNDFDIVHAIETPIASELDISRARVVAKELANQVGLNAVEVYSIVTCVSELAYNILFHAHAPGRVISKVISRADKSGIEIEAVDHGRGIEKIDLALTDGYSTNKGLGGGLPGVKRLMDEFDISSQPTVGTRIIVRKWRN